MSSTLLVRTRYGPGERHDPHAHAYTSISIVLAGSLLERVGATEETAGPLSVVVKPAGTEHADVFGSAGAVLLRLHVAPEWLTELDDGSAAIGRWRWCQAPATARWLLRLAARTSDSACSIEDSVAECLGALEGGAIASGSAADGAPPWLRQVHDRIRDERGRAVNVAVLARDAGVHPVYLTRRFRRAYGCSIVAFGQAERVRQAAGAIAATDAPLSAVAYGAGFADQSHLTRTFKSVAGMTPAAYRRLVRGPEVGIVQDGQPARP